MAKKESEVAVEAPPEKKDKKPFTVEVTRADRLANLLADDAQYAGCTVVGKVNANKLRFTLTFAEDEDTANAKIEAFRKKRAEEETKLQKLMRQPIIGTSHGPIGA